MASPLRSRLSSLQTPEPTSDAVSESGKAARPILLSYDQMPKWFRQESNKYILSGYRDISGSFITSLCSLSYLHNESVNIYSHLIPAVFFFLGEWYIQQYSEVTGADSIALSIFMLAAVTCLSLSVAYHTLMNHSKRVGHFCLRLDMLGVVVFILGDLVLGIYLVFWCERLLRNIYWSLVSRTPCAKFCSSSKTQYLFLTFFFFLSIECSYRNAEHLRDNASQVPRPRVPPPPNIDVRSNWIFRCFALGPWHQHVRPIADVEKSISIYASKSRLPPIGNFVLPGKSSNTVEKRDMDPNARDSGVSVS